MADVTPNWKVEIQRLKMQIAAQRSTIERQRLENMELEDRISRNNENLGAAEKAITELVERLGQLEAEHGA